MAGIREAVREALLDAAAVLLPVDCAGCGTPDRGVCARCRTRLRPDPVLREVDGLPVWAGLRYEEVPRRVILALKESGRTDVARVLGPALLAAVRAGVDGPVELCAVPPSRRGQRRRGYDPVRLVASHAGLPVRRLLTRRRTPAAVQKTLSLVARAENSAGTLTARTRLDGRRIVVVDDVVTSGATLREARRALVAAGAEVVGAAVIASVPRRQEARRRPSGIPRPEPGDSGCGAD